MEDQGSTAAVTADAAGRAGRAQHALAGHGAVRLSAVVVDACNAELRDDEGFVGDRASRRAFCGILDDWRSRLRAATGADPLGGTASGEIGKKQLGRLLARGDVEAAGVVFGAVEDFAQELASVVRRFLRLEEWRGTQRIAVGGGFRGGRIGELAIARAAAMLLAENRGLELRPTGHHPDEAGLVGCAHLAPRWVFAGHDAVLAVDIGGTNIRAGVVALGPAKGLAEARVWRSELWRHADEAPTRDAAVERLGDTLHGLVRRARKEGLQLAPFVGVGCPGLIAADGAIERGGHNLPGGDWEGGGFNLPERLRGLLPEVDGHETAVVMQNDAVVQGLSEIPAMRDVERWGVLTIGTGLGNARFTNRAGRSGRR